MSELARVAIPALFPNDESVYVTACYVVNGESVEAGADIISMEFSKAAVELEAPVSGFIRLLCAEQDEVKVGDTVAIIFETEAEALHDPASAVVAPESSPVYSAASDAPACGTAVQADTRTVEKDPVVVPKDNGAAVVREPVLIVAPVEADSTPVFSKEALRVMQEHGLGAERFSGQAFVRTADVRAVLQPAQAAQPAASFPVSKKTDAPSPKLPTTSVPFTSEKASVGKVAEVRNLLNGQNLATSNFQKSIRTQGALAGSGGAFGSLGSMPIVLRECCCLLKKYKHLNGFYHEGDLCFFDELNIGYAVDLGKGLQVINLGDISESTDKEISLKIMTGVKAYMTGRLAPQDMAKVTFNVTDLSNEGVEFFIPLLGKWQSGSLGICSTDKVSGAFKVSLTFDHRVTEGRLAATFLRDLAAAVEAKLNG